jgi:hypothetical protein
VREDLFTMLFPLKTHTHVSHFSLPHSTQHKSLSPALLHKRSSLIFRFGYIYLNAYTVGAERSDAKSRRQTHLYLHKILVIEILVIEILVIEIMVIEIIFIDISVQKYKTVVSYWYLIRFLKK